MIVDATGVSRRFGRFEAVQDLALQVPEGSVFALIGPNGSGKTTTLRMLMNILQPDAGRISVLGTDSRALRAAHFRRIGYVSESQKIPGRLTVEQYLRWLRHLYPDWDPALEADLCAQFELPPDRRLQDLSHGMRMKVLLVAALAFRPRLLVLDEPLSGLDTLVRDEVVNGLLQQALDTTILISSHELAEIESFTTHVAFMQAGRLLLQESIDSLRERFREVTVTLAATRTLPAEPPAHWLMPEISGHQLHFFDSQGSDEQARYQLLVRLFGPVKVWAEPMGLRAIASALMLDRRRRARTSAGA